MEIDGETADKDREKKEKGKQYADARRNAKEISIKKGDEVLVKRMVKANKLSFNFEAEIYKVIERNGGDVTVASNSGKEYRRHISHLQKISSEVPATSTTPIGDPNNHDTSNIDRPTADGSVANCKEQRSKPANNSNIQPRVTRASKRPAHLKDFVI